MTIPLSNDTKRQFIVIDQAVTDYQILINQFPESTPYLVLDSNRDGLEQLSTALAGMTDLSAIHIISHGSPGSLQLGSIQLNDSSLAEYALSLERIGQSLVTEGDLLIYGCDVAEGEAGTAFIQRLAEMTGADVAASNNPTGAIVLGANWILEQNTGLIETPTLFLISPLPQPSESRIRAWGL